MRRGDRGSALVIVVLALFLAVIIGGVALSNTVGALRDTDHQQNVKRAQHAADAAIEAAIYGLNRLALVESVNIDPLDPGTITDQNCVVALEGGTALDVVDLPPLSSWCPETTGSLDGATWAFRVSQVARVGNGSCGDGALLSLDRRIVAVGSSRGVDRRVSATLRAPVSLFSGAAVQSGATTTALQMSGTATVTGNVHANASITGTSGAPVITGNATAGPGGSVSGVVPAGVSGVACHRFSLPPVDQAGAPSDNDNAGLDTSDLQSGDCVDHLLDMLPVLCDPPLLPKTGGFDWDPDPDARTLRVWGNGVFRLPADTYSFCSIRLEGQGILLVPPGTHDTRIFLDSPENCSGVTGAGQITSDGLSRIVNCHPQTSPGTLQLYAAGSSSVATTQTFAGGGTLSGTLMAGLCGVNIPLAGTPMIVYAPRSQVTLAGNAAIAGQVAANVVQMSGAATVTSVASLVNLNALGSKPVLPLYRPQNYVACTSRTFAQLPDGDPSIGC